MDRTSKLWFSIIGIYFVIACVLACRKIPTVDHARKTRGDNGYRLYLGDEPNGYEPGKIYNLFLLGSRTHSRLQQFSHFLITAQAANENNNRYVLLNAGPRRVGRFQLFADSLATFNERCINTVSESDDLPKSEIQVLWVAPAAGSGCVALSAMVYENSASWFADDGQLKKIICEKKPEKKLDTVECCACDEAKYNFVFQGIWSNETHPKDYPFAVWLTHFSDVIGGSHDTNFSFWGENHIATDGFRSMAEWGSVRLLEIELRAKAPRLKTLVKAAGLWYPDVNQNTSSHFKVDRRKHKLSLVSMFGPSPDWVVGVSGLNLCRPDCTWTESMDIDLHPWDSGTDNGISYMSANSATIPREKMRPITTMYPEDPRAPFYNPNSSEMTPLAKLYIRREKVISRTCDFDLDSAEVLDDAENSEGPVRQECITTEFSDWTPCSVTCGKGIRTRTREYADMKLSKTASCGRQLVSREMCVADVAECPEGSNNDDEDGDLDIGSEQGTSNDQGEGIGVCETTPWSVWAPCSATCGVGISMRNRYFKNHMGIKKCPHITIVEKEKCMSRDCTAADIEAPDPMCPVGQWSDWSPCSVSCGRGVSIRRRLLLVEPNHVEFCTPRIKLDEQRACDQSESCAWSEATARENCNLPVDNGQCRGTFARYAYIAAQKSCRTFNYGGCRGNPNNFLTEEDCLDHCRFVGNERSTIPAQDLNACELTEWTDWTACSVSCGNGRETAYRQYVNELNRSGCRAEKLFKTRKCTRAPCRQ